MMRRFLAALVAAILMAGIDAAHARHHHHRKGIDHIDSPWAAEAKGYRKVSSLVNFPGFFPGLGVLYVIPGTLPEGPFISFDHWGKLVATIYMIPVQDMNDQKRFELSGSGGRNDHTSFYFGPGHPGVPMPHYHFVIWHVTKKGEARVAE